MIGISKSIFYVCFSSLSASSLMSRQHVVHFEWSITDRKCRKFAGSELKGLSICEGEELMWMMYLRTSS